MPKIQIGIVGGGTMGAGIAQVFSYNNEVVIVDIKQSILDAAQKQILKSSNKLFKKSKITEDQKSNAQKKVKYSQEIDDLKDCDLVIECVNENLELKSMIFEKLSRLVGKDAVIGSNTSSIPINKLSQAVDNPERFLGLHFFNPAPIMNLVEIIKGKHTSDETIQKAKNIVESLGKEPIIVKDSPAFVTSRLLMVMINEAIHCLYERIASKEDIDKAMKLGMNHPMGPLALADMVGLDVVLAIMQCMYENFQDEKYKPCPLLIMMVDEGELGKKTGSGFYEYK